MLRLPINIHKRYKLSAFIFVNLFKRLGLGKHLITKAIELAEEAEKETVWLGVWEHNHPAQKFYQSLGFVKTDEHDFYMGNERHTDYTMTKQLKEST